MDTGSTHIINFVTALNESNDRFVELGEIFSRLGYDCKLSTLFAFPAVRGKVVVREAIACLAFRALELSIIAPLLFR